VRTEFIFRQANERIRQAAEEQDLDIPVPFICECPNPRCSQIILIPLDEYRAIRADPARFINKTGHESAGVLARHDQYVVVDVLAYN
jgi:hypothetical protein